MAFHLTTTTVHQQAIALQPLLGCKHSTGPAMKKTQVTLVASSVLVILLFLLPLLFHFRGNEPTGTVDKLGG